VTARILLLRSNPKTKLFSAPRTPALSEISAAAYVGRLQSTPLCRLTIGLGRRTATVRPVQIPDLAATKSYIERHPGMVEAVELAGIRTGRADFPGQ
jgi:hypothetical protein